MSTSVERKPAATRAESADSRGPAFVTTHWSVVLSAQEKDTERSAEALETLCRAYWFPLYAYVRRFGHNPPDAQDLTQEFFARLLARHYLDSVDREKGRFRTFLLTALKRFLAQEWERAHARKRGGGQQVVPFDTQLAEQLYSVEQGSEASPDTLFERRCALTLLDVTFKRLAEEFAAAGKVSDFETLKPYLTAERGGIPYAELAARLNRDESAARVAVHRFRKRYRELFREQVARTVARPEDVDAEMRHLLAVLGA